MLKPTFPCGLMVTLLLCFGLTAGKRKLDDVFEVAKGSVPGTCDPHLRVLEIMFDEIQDITDNAVEQLADVKYNNNAETRKLLQSLFGIMPSASDEVPSSGLDSDKFLRVIDWYEEIQREVANPGGSAAKTQLYCDSDFMTHYNLNDPSPSNPQQTVAQALGAPSLSTAQNSWIYHVPTQAQSAGGAWLLLPKTLYPKNFPSGQYGKPSYCAQDKTYAWTIEAETGERSQPIVILCPEAFTKNNLNGGSVPDKLDLAEQNTGKVLDEMEPRLLTFYHELFHLTQPPLNGVEQSPDAQFRRARRNKGRPIGNWPRDKSAFLKQGSNTYGGVECMYTALWDLANPAATKLKDLEATKNPETYAWFAVGSYLNVFGNAHQDWSSGACRPKGSPAQTVTVERGSNVPRQTDA